MRTSIIRTLLVLVALLPAFAAAVDSGFVPPTAVFYHTDFDTPAPVPDDWQIDAGSWSANSGSYKSTSSLPTATTTISEYLIDPNGIPQDRMARPYTFRARVSNQGASETRLAGVVFDYVDAANYSEAVFSSIGRYLVRNVRDGVSTVLVNSSYPGSGPNVWFDVEVIRGDDTVHVRVNGVGGTPVGVGPLAQFGGRLGLTTHNVTARFDKVSIAVPFTSQQPFKENFSSPLSSQWLTTGQWSVAGGTLNNTSVQQTSTAEHNSLLIQIAAESTLSYSLRARMLNPYGGAGNLVGMYFNAGPAGDTITGPRGRVEVLFSPRGVARIDRIVGGTTETLATAAYPGRSNQWFDVRADVGIGSITVAVNGTTLFDDIQTAPVFQGSGGLITHWAPGKFDDVWFDNRGTFAPLAVPFDSALPADWILSGTWNTSGGTLDNVSAGVSDIVTTNCGCWETDISYRARLLNQYTASGNLVGLVYNYQRSTFDPGGPKPYRGLYRDDYYEVVFAPTGEARINKVINGARYLAAVGFHSVPINTWFDVEVLRQGVNTTIKVNGVTLFNRVPQGELSFGDVGVVSHWSKARFDNLTITDAPLR